MNKIRNENGGVISDTTEIQRIVRDYYEPLYINKLDNLEEMDKFLGTYNLPRLNHEDIKKLNRLITSKEIESVIKNLPEIKVQDQTASLVNSTKYSNTNLSQTIPKNRRERNTSKLILEGQHYPDTKT